MKKSLLWFILFFGVLVCHAQSQRFELNWTASILFSTANNEIELPYFDAKNFNFSIENGITYTALFDAKFEINEESAEITQIESVSVPISDLKDLKQSSIPNEVQLNVSNVKTRGNLLGSVEISAFFKDNGVIKKVKNFTIS